LEGKKKRGNKRRRIRGVVVGDEEIRRPVVLIKTLGAGNLQIRKKVSKPCNAMAGAREWVYWGAAEEPLAGETGDA
jgi:hypothetical protein